MDGMTINHIVSIDHGSHGFPGISPMNLFSSGEFGLQFLSGSAVGATSQAGSGRRFLQDAGQEGDLGQRTLAGWLHHC